MLNNQIEIFHPKYSYFIVDNIICEVNYPRSMRSTRIFKKALFCKKIFIPTKSTKISTIPERHSISDIRIVPICDII